MGDERIAMSTREALPAVDIGGEDHRFTVVRAEGEGSRLAELPDLVALVAALRDEQIIALGIEAVMIRRFQEARCLPIFLEPEWEHRATIDGIEETERRRVGALARAERAERENEVLRCVADGAEEYLRTVMGRLKLEAALALYRDVTSTRPEPEAEACPECGGVGTASGFGDVKLYGDTPCPTCAGSGKRPSSEGGG